MQAIGHTGEPPDAGRRSDGPLNDAVTAIVGGPDEPPGGCLAVRRRGRVAWAARGVAQAFDDAGAVADPQPMTLDVRVDLGSVTKVLATTTSLLALTAAGELSLELRLADSLPWTRSAPCASATLAQLLQHRAGLWEWWPVYIEADGPEAALRVAADRPLRYRPDDGRHYSDLGFQLLGGVIAAATGRALPDVVAELVTEPLGLGATTYRRPAPGGPVAASSRGDRIEARMVDTGEPYPVDVDASAFTRWRTRVLVGEVNDGNAFHAFGSAAGHAGMFSTARDLLGFGDALLHSLAGGGPLDRAVLRRFLTPGADPGQGLGFRRWRVAGHDAWGHTGFPGVAVAVIPDLDCTVALVTNRLHVPGSPRPTEPAWTRCLHAALIHCEDT